MSFHSPRVFTLQAKAHAVLTAALAPMLLLGLSGMHGAALSADATADKPPGHATPAKTVPAAKRTAKGEAKTPVSPELPVVKIDNPWIRPTVKGQTATGGFMGLTASRDLTLLGFSTPVASEPELHEMAMEGDVMRMRAIDNLPLPADQAVALQPGAGGKHLMLMGLKRQLKAGETVRLTLKLQGADGKVFTQDVTVPVRAGTASGAAPASHEHDGHEHHHQH